MTTNQTIDGVPRELLEALVSIHPSDTRYRLAKEELRALLDAPVCKTCNGTRLVSDGALHCSSGGIPFENGLIDCVKDCPDCAPAAQPKGEPVAWMYKREGGECLGQLVQMESDSLKDVREGKVCQGRRILWPREDYIDWKPLYAEQPAPVADPLAKGFTTLESENGKYKIVTSFQARDDAWSAYRVLVGAGPKPVTVAPTAYDGFDNRVD